MGADSRNDARHDGHLKTPQMVSENVPEELVQQMVSTALAEDLGDGDINAMLVNEDEIAYAKVITRVEIIVCGLRWVVETFKQIDPTLTVELSVKDGEKVPPNTLLFEVRGKARGVLSGERTSLNFLQLLSGVATETRRYVDAVAHCKCKILDTRKTLPGFRMAQKYAVNCAGAVNHRIGLYDAFLIKENHIMSCGGSITQAVSRAQEIGKGKLIEVEVESFNELKEAMEAGADVVMLDNFSVADTRKAVEIVAESSKKVVLESSGNVTLDTIAEVAETGVDYISVGALTKHVKAADLSMRFVIERANGFQNCGG